MFEDIINMIEYHKISNIFERDPLTNNLIEGKFRMPELEYLKDCEWLATEKVDGTNIRVHFTGSDVVFCGRTDSAQLLGPLVEWLNKKFQTITARELFKAKFPTGITLYGEGYGGSIQKSGETYGGVQRFVLFDVLIDGYWLERGNVRGVADIFELDIVPTVKEGTLMEIVDFIKTKPNSTWGPFEMEGVVARPRIELFTRHDDRLVVKIKCRDFK